MDLKELDAGSPLIHWLIPKLPMLLQSAVLSFLIILLTRSLFGIDAVFQLTIPLFVILTMVTAHSPHILDGLQYGIGFALAAVMFKFSWPSHLKAIFK
jgi:hypothetical protein